MALNTENKSLLFTKEIEITPQLSIRIPTVQEVLENESAYFGLVSILTSTPFQYMVQLDDLGIDYTKITDFETFQLFFPIYANQDISIIFGDLNLKDITRGYDYSTELPVLYSPSTHVKIDEFVYVQMAQLMRKINLLKYDRRKPKGEKTKQYLLEKERRHLKNLEIMNKNKAPKQSIFERLIIALVNNEKFKYNFETVRNLSIYNFYRSFQHIQHEINFNNIMRGVYAGTIDINKIQDKSILSWMSPEN